MFFAYSRSNYDSQNVRTNYEQRCSGNFSVLGADSLVSVMLDDESTLAEISAAEVEELIEQDIQEILAEYRCDDFYADLMEDYTLCTNPYISGVLFMVYCVALKKVGKKIRT